jgi:predicted aspartyl protease
MRPFPLLAAALTAGLFASPVLAFEPCLAVDIGADGSPVVRAMVTGQGPFDFVLDTAASGTTLDETTATRLDLTRDTATETAEGLGGPTDVHLYRVPSLTAGPLSLANFTAPAITAPDLPGHAIVGLAGIDLFGEALAVWGERPGCVTIKATGARPGGDDWRPVEVNWIRPWKIMLPVRINGVDGWGLLDTGAQHTVLNPAFAARLGLSGGQLSDGGEISGIDGRPMALSMATAEAVRVGEWAWTDRVLRIGDLPVFARLGEAEAPLAIIGIDWLGDRGFAIDYGAQRVWQRTP